MEESRKIVLIGTAHVSKKSVEEAERIIENERPSAVAVELDPRRYMALRGERVDINPVEIIKKGNVFLFLFQLFLSRLQKKIGKETGVRPGEEMLTAIKKAEEIGADVLLIDRDLGITMKRLWNTLSFFDKVRLFYYFIRGLFETDEVEVDELLEKDILDMMVDEFRKISPKTAEILVDERDAYMAYNLLKASMRYERIVAVVGAGHKDGIERFMQNPEEIPDMRDLVEIKNRRFSFLKIAGVLITLTVAFIFLSILLYMGTSEFVSAFIAWFLINGIPSAIFAAIAGGHILSVLTAFFVAWLTSLSPLLAAGWFSGVVEFIMRKPTHDDFEEMMNAESFKELYRNRAFRILLVAGLTNIGSMIGTFYGVWYLSTKYGVNVKDIVFQALQNLYQAFILSGLNPFLTSNSLTFAIWLP